MKIAASPHVSTRDDGGQSGGGRSSERRGTKRESVEEGYREGREGRLRVQVYTESGI